MKKRRGLHNSKTKLLKSLERSIAYQTSLTVQNPSTISQSLPTPDFIRPKLPGLLVAVSPSMPDDASQAARLISNSPDIEIPVDAELPDEYKFEIYRLRRRTAELEATIRDKDNRIVRALAMLEDELQMFRTYLNDHVGETIGTLHKRINRLESTLAFLKDKQAHIEPKLEIPLDWQSDKGRQ